MTPYQRVHKRVDARRRLADVLGIRQETATKQMRACGRALRPLIRRYKVDGALVHPLIEQHRAEILAIAERRGLRDVRVFGSMARGDAAAASGQTRPR